MVGADFRTTAEGGGDERLLASVCAGHWPDAERLVIAYSQG